MLTDTKLNVKILILPHLPINQHKFLTHSSDTLGVSLS